MIKNSYIKFLCNSYFKTTFSSLRGVEQQIIKKFTPIKI